MTVDRVNILLAIVSSMAGCASSSGPYSPQAESSRDSAKAQGLTLKAAAIIDTDPVKAQALLREALTADLFCGPAHNDLGVILLNQNALYSAASEFQFAIKLMPGHPDPRMNLALTLECAGRTDEAITAYASVLETCQNHLPTIEAMTRLQIKSGRTNDKTKANLEEIAFKSDQPSWREWARRSSPARFLDRTITVPPSRANAVRRRQATVTSEASPAKPVHARARTTHAPTIAISPRPWHKV